jgi:aspartyl-tRNA(Asn)/glutamyl-tRNA(Gln) amidotransferase subunit A
MGAFCEPRQVLGLQLSVKLASALFSTGKQLQAMGVPRRRRGACAWPGAAITRAAVQAMEREGAIVETVALDFVSLEPHFLVILQSLLAGRIGADLERFGTRLDATLIEAVLKGRRHSAVDLQRAARARTRCFGELQALLLRVHLYPMNLTGHPALSMPCGWSAGGLPVGLQLVGRWHDDACLLGLAALLEGLLGA